jgi:Ca-activated chloride channel family protein
MFVGSDLNHRARYRSLVALGLVASATALGILPVGKFFGAVPAPVPPTPKPPFEGPGILVPTTANPSRANVRAGHVTLEAILGQSKLLRREDGTVYLDLKLTADEIPGKVERRPVDLALVLDVSGSMADENKIGLLRQASLGLADQLSPEDRVAVISFSDDARVLFPLQSLPLQEKPSPERQQYDSAICRLVPSGSTNLSSGLEAGAAELRRAARSGAARRLLLLTDGIANRGVSTPDGLRSITGRLASEGFSISTVGLGLDTNASLLSMLSDVGGGNYTYVDGGDKIAAVYATELKGLRALVARGLHLLLKPADGVSIDEVVAWANDAQPDGTRHVTVGDLESGRSTKVVVRLRVPTDRAVTAEDVVSVALKGEDASSGEVLAPSPALLGIGITEDRAVADASVATDVQKDLVNARVASELSRARLLAEQGRYDDARRSFEELRKLKVDEVSFKDALGRTEHKALAELEHDLCEPCAAPADRSRADKCMVSGTTAVGK